MELPFLRSVSPANALSLIATCKPFAFSQKAQVTRPVGRVAELGSLGGSMRSVMKGLFLWSGILLATIVTAVLLVGVNIFFWVPLLLGVIMIVISRRGMASQRTSHQAVILALLWVLSLLPFLPYIWYD